MYMLRSNLSCIMRNINSVGCVFTASCRQILMGKYFFANKSYAIFFLEIESAIPFSFNPHRNLNPLTNSIMYVQRCKKVLGSFFAGYKAVAIMKLHWCITHLKLMNN